MGRNSAEQFTLQHRRLYRYQNWLLNRAGVSCVVGVDEAGRGPLAGPVVAAAVVLSPDRPIVGLRDSKQLTHQRRQQLAAEIKELALAWSLGEATAGEIDRVNILQATFLAMRRALAGLSVPTNAATEGLVLVDGRMVIPGINWRQRSVVKGDARVAAISAASILAKVHRDNYMCEVARRYPGYGFERNKGYGTKEHLAALDNLGPTPEHRRSFAPVDRVQLQLFET
ncbi:MAG: ribonuclease HII [Firmicutes bacterium]|nr:ribonuclease HII [Bacillota bacterium]